MPLGALILVQPTLAGNVGAAVRIAANFGVPRLDIVGSTLDADDDAVQRWACGADELVEVTHCTSFRDAAAPYRTVIASASGRGRPNVPVLDPREAVTTLSARGLSRSALVFGNETRGLSRDHLDRCDAVVRIPTRSEFPVLNLAQAVAILTAECAIHGHGQVADTPKPATQDEVEELMAHLRRSLLTIGFLDPESPQRILRKLRRMFGRAGITANEVSILRGICRQMDWAARSGPLPPLDEVP